MESEGKIIEVEYNNPEMPSCNGDFSGSYFVYVPENVNPNTPMHIYIPGSGGSANDTTPLKDYVNNNGSNSIVVMPKWDGVSDGPNNYAIASLMISDEVIAKYGLTGNNVSVSGFSNGSRPAMLAAYDSLAGNYKTKINSVVSIDGSVKLSAEEYKLLADNKVTVYAIIKKDDDSKDLENYVKMGGQVVLMRSIGGHVEKNRNAFKNGIIDYLNGTGNLSGLEGYSFEMFDIEKNSWYNLSYEELKEKIKTGEVDATTLLNTLDSTSTPISFSAEEIVQSDKQELLTYLNDIRKNLTLAVSVNSYNSSTAIPNSESDAVQEFFEGTQRLFQVIDADTKFILSAATSLEDLDTLLANKASTLGGSSTLGNIITGVTTSIGAALGMLFMGVPGAASGALLGNKVGSLIGQFFGLETSSKTVEVNTNVTSVDLNSRKGITANTKNIVSSTTTTKTDQIIQPNIIPVDPDTILKAKTTSTTETPVTTETKQTTTSSGATLLDPSTFSKPKAPTDITNKNSEDNLIIHTTILPVDPFN